VSFVNKPFSGATFFTDARALMKLDRGMLAGRDGPFRYVVMDALFYRLDVYVRPPTMTFTDGAEALEANDVSVRVIANAQHCSNYSSKVGPGPVDWQGEIVTETYEDDGSPNLDFRRHMYFGQWAGIGEQSYWIQRGYPSEVTSPTRLRNAIGRLIPLITNGIPFGPEEKRDPTTGALIQKNSNAVSGWRHEWDFTGKVIAGIHRSAQAVFVFIQEHQSVVNGQPLAAVISLLRSMGIDDAVMGDGSTSVALTVDGTTEVSPLFLKNYNISTGFAFHLQKFNCAAGATLTANITSTHPQFPTGFVATSVVAELHQAFGGVRLELTDFGSGGGMNNAAIVAALGVTLPLTLESSTSLMSGLTTFRSGTDVRAALDLQGTVTSPGRLVGTLSIDTAQGRAGFDVNWSLEAVDDR
jgi:hypothetical protein